MTLLLSFLVILILILINGLYVAAEFAIIGVRPSRVAQLVEEGNQAAVAVQKVVTNPNKTDRYIAAAQLGITLASLGLGMYAEPVIAHVIEGPLEDAFGLSEAAIHTISFISALTLITYLHVVIGEMVPKSLSLQNPEKMVLLLAGPMALSQRIFALPITILNRIGLGVLRLIGVPPPSGSARGYSPDELELIVSESRAGGMLEEREQALVANIFDFSERRVEEVMTPRPRIDAVPVDIHEAELDERFVLGTHTRLPVYEGSLDNILGVVHLKDVVRRQLRGEPFDLRAVLRKVPFVPETLPVDQLLASMRRQHIHLAVVVDEHGGTLGLVTLEDLVEEVVGEVRDEFDEKENEPLVVVGPGHLEVEGSLPLADIEEYVDLGEIEYDVNTVGGLVMAGLGRLPNPGEEVQVRGVRLRVEAVKGLAVRRVSIFFKPDKGQPVNGN